MTTAYVPSRREFIGALGAGAVATGLAGCESMPPLPLPPPAMTDDLSLRLLQRISFGPKTADVARINAIGMDEYLAEQLDYENIEDGALAAQLDGLNTIDLDITQLRNRAAPIVAGELIQATMIRAVHSERQLLERMVEFWTDHFNIYHQKEPIRILKTIDDREVVRAHALGRFEDLLLASAKSPAMLVYLDNNTNVAGSPNENYPREVLELHSVGVDGGYTQGDIEELARALTGWTVAEDGPDRGRFVFRAEDHDTGAKQVMGLSIPAGGGIEDGEMALRYLAGLPQTAGFIAYKLVRHFIADEPPTQVVDTVAKAFADSDGDIRTTLLALFQKENLEAAQPKLKRPFHLFVDAMRRSNTSVEPQLALGQALQMMGHVPFQWPAPNGYPNVAAYWAPGLLNRWNFAAAFGNGALPGVTTSANDIAEVNDVRKTEDVVALWNQMFYHGEMPAEEVASLTAYIDAAPNDNARRYRESFALALSGPGFQWY